MRGAWSVAGARSPRGHGQLPDRRAAGRRSLPWQRDEHARAGPGPCAGAGARPRCCSRAKPGSAPGPRVGPRCRGGQRDRPRRVWPRRAPPAGGAAGAGCRTCSGRCAAGAACRSAAGGAPCSAASGAPCSAASATSCGAAGSAPCSAASAASCGVAGAASCGVAGAASCSAARCARSGGAACRAPGAARSAWRVAAHPACSAAAGCTRDTPSGSSGAARRACGAAGRDPGACRCCAHSGQPRYGLCVGALPFCAPSCCAGMYLLQPQLLNFIRINRSLSGLQWL